LVPADEQDPEWRRSALKVLSQVNFSDVSRSELTRCARFAFGELAATGEVHALAALARCGEIDDPGRCENNMRCVQKQDLPKHIFCSANVTGEDDFGPIPSLVRVAQVMHGVSSFSLFFASCTFCSATA